MADSDDDSELRRTRDKFRRERSDVDGRREKREPFDERVGAGHSNASRSRLDRRLPSDYRPFGGSRDRPQFGGDLPAKRPRRDWNDDHRPSYRSRDVKKDFIDEETNYRPPLMPFKRFLEPLDDFITDEEALAKYKEYRESFNKRYIEEFFEAHKDEEWLREKYHPDFMDNTREQIAKNIRQRLDVFLDLFDKGMVDNQSVEVENSQNLIKLMDAVVIKLNGGTDEDLAILDEPAVKIGEDKVDHRSHKKESHRDHSSIKSEEGEDSDFESDEESNARKSCAKPIPSPHPKNSPKNEVQAPGNDWTGVSSESEPEEKSKVEEPTHDDEEDYGGDARESDTEVFKKDEIEKSKLSPLSLTKSPDRDAKNHDVKSDESEDPVQGQSKSDEPLLQNVDSGAEVPAPAVTDYPMEDFPVTECGVDSSVVVPSPEQNGLKSALPRRDLHKTSSIFFRCLPPTITRKELEDICSSQPGFIRLAIYDPMPERRFTRHAWATYKPNVNIKKICWALNTNPLLREKWQQGSGNNSSDLCATVNRDLAQRVRPVAAALTRHRPVMRNDLRIASRLIAQLDAKHSLWSLPGEEDNEAGGTAVTNACPVPGLPGIFSANPLMRNLTDFLVDETASEEEAMLSNNSKGRSNADSNGDKLASAVPLDTDPSLLRALDRLIIYLRIVYSIDYYSATMYQLEDLMPHRCGIFHARGTLDTRGPTPPTVTQREISDYISVFNEKMASLLEVPRDLTDEEIAALGARDPEKAAEDFIEANIQKRTSKKKPYKVVWVCPLSDKKFREPVFVRKHILNKHLEKVEAAKKDNAVFFNNFLRDPRRPSLPEAPRHLIQRYYPPPQTGGGGPGEVGDRAVGMRGRNLGGYRAGSGGGYRGGGGGYRNNPVAYGRREFYGGDGGGGSHQGLAAAAAAAAAAALYPNSAPTADLYALAALGGGGRGGSPRGGGDYGGRFNEYNSRKRPYPGDRHRPGGRSVISYNDLDDPGNDGF
uniref:Serrate RNA effector molecule homolog n=1 Tax=Mesocestoides corti TaxID=53468 RepID=A0A5K3ES13_MESCO